MISKSLRKKLELVAKATNFSINYVTDPNIHLLDAYHSELPIDAHYFIKQNKTTKMWEPWFPHQDIRDAMEIAQYLVMTIKLSMGYQIVQIPGCEEVRACGRNQSQALCTAICNAAATLGEIFVNKIS